MSLPFEDSRQVRVATEFEAANGHGCALLAVKEHTTLRKISEMLPADMQSLLLVTDRNEQVVGVVCSDEVRRRLEQGHEQERIRWLQMPIGALTPFRMPSVFQSFDWMPQHGGDAAPRSRGTTAFLTGEDVFVSWRSLAPQLEEAFRDNVTGLPNRAGLELRLKQDWLRAEHEEVSLSVLMIDLDHFKTINDTLGHVFADGVLKEVALALKDSVRSYDVLTRYGGDEFLAICVGCGAEEIALPVQRMFDALAEICFDPSGALTASASIGAAVCKPGLNCESETDLMRAADDALYAAKRFQRGTAFISDFSTAGTPEPAQLAAELVGNV